MWREENFLLLKEKENGFQGHPFCNLLKIWKIYELSWVTLIVFRSFYTLPPPPPTFIMKFQDAKEKGRFWHRTLGFLPNRRFPSTDFSQSRWNGTATWHTGIELCTNITSQCKITWHNALQLCTISPWHNTMAWHNTNCVWSPLDILGVIIQWNLSKLTTDRSWKSGQHKQVVNLHKCVPK